MAADFEDTWFVQAVWRLRDRWTGPWELLVLASTYGAKAWIQIRRSRRNRWTWHWTEEYLGKATSVYSPCATAHWRDCMASLQAALDEMGYQELAEDLPHLGARSNDDGG